MSKLTDTLKIKLDEDIENICSLLTVIDDIILKLLRQDSHEWNTGDFNLLCMHIKTISNKYSNAKLIKEILKEK